LIQIQRAHLRVQATFINLMKAPIDVVRLTASEKELLSRIKRKSSVDSWNVLCRWALALALSSDLNHLTRSQERRDAVEIRWETFAGQWSDVINASVRIAFCTYKCDGQPVSLSDFFQMVLARGIRMLAKQTAASKDACFAILVKSESTNLPSS